MPHIGQIDKTNINKYKIYLDLQRGVQWRSLGSVGASIGDPPLKVLVYVSIPAVPCRNGLARPVQSIVLFGAGTQLHGTAGRETSPPPLGRFGK